MKKSSKVELSLLAALAFSLTGCRSSADMQRCVDDGNVVAPDQFCSQGFAAHYHWGVGPAGQRQCLNANNQPVNEAACSYTMGRHYHWYYGGRGSYAPGSVAYEGSEFPRSTARYATATDAHGGSASGESGKDGVSRGGFGRAGAGGRGA